MGHKQTCKNLANHRLDRIIGDISYWGQEDKMAGKGAASFQIRAEEAQWVKRLQVSSQ
jgi:hypothetical protein